MINRLCKLPKDNSFFLFGARATGKTSLLNGAFHNKPNILYIDLLNEDIFEKYALMPQMLKKEIDLLKHRPQWVVIDEVQRVPKLLNIAHQLIESKDSIKFAMTGSSSRRLKQKGMNLLAGRAWVRNLYPFTFLELQDEFNLSQILNWGSLPKLQALPEHQDKIDYLKAYATTYLKTEIQEEQWVRKLEPFMKFLPIAAQMNGRPLNYSSISRDAGAEISTIKTYFEILEDTLLGFFIPSFSKSVRKQQRVAPKFYFFDLGVKKALQKTLTVNLNPHTTEWGFAFEHLLICEFIRANEYFGKEFQFSYLLTKDDFEVDLIVERPGKKTLYIEIKSSEKVHAQEFTRFAHFVSEQKGMGYVLSNDPTARKDQGLLFLPWQAGIREIFEMT